MITTQNSTRRERREAAREQKNTVSTHHHGVFGVWQWDVLTEQEKAWYMEAQKRNQYCQLFGIYGGY